MRPAPLIGIVLAAGVCNAQPLPDCGNQAAGLASARWRSTEISVCWEASAAAFGAEKQAVRSAVAETWERNSSLRFTGWQPCTADGANIRITVEDIGQAPHTQGVGSQLDNRPAGMALNFTFRNWGGTECVARREYCVRVVAVHEFGHALGFTHEQNRRDAPAWCREEKQGGEPDAILTQYDPQSVMNYCNPRWNNEGLLTARDIQGLQTWYGRPAAPRSRYEGRLSAQLSYSDRTCQSDRIELTVNNGTVQGAAITPQGLRIPVRGQISSDSMLTGLNFNFSPRDRVEITGRFPHALVRSSDCGCGSTKFAPQGQ